MIEALTRIFPKGLVASRQVRLKLRFRPIQLKAIDPDTVRRGVRDERAQFRQNINWARSRRIRSRLRSRSLVKNAG